MKSEYRTSSQLREHYEIEKKLADRLRNASRQERRYLYTSLYDELYQRVPFHSQLIRKSSSQKTAIAVFRQMQFLKSLLNKEITFLEVGPGDCSLSLEVTDYVKQVYAVDVSSEITKDLAFPQNFKLILSDGCSMPLPASSVNIVYSYQLMEHLHPDDAFEQLQNIYNVLVPAGIYICVTPNRLSGPHDISRYFDKVATGFHLKEYTVSELSDLFKKVGFSSVEAYVGGRGFYAKIPLCLLIFFEKFLDKFPYKFKALIARSFLFRLLLGIRLIGKK